MTIVGYNYIFVDSAYGSLLVSLIWSNCVLVEACKCMLIVI